MGKFWIGGLFMGSENQKARNARVVADFASGLTYPNLQRKYGLSLGSVRNIVSAWRTEQKQALAHEICRHCGCPITSCAPY